MSNVKTYANKAGIVKFIKNNGLTCTHLPKQTTLGRWYAMPVTLLNAVSVPLIKVATKPLQVKLFGKGIKIQKDRVTQNGVTQPSKGGKCRAVWDQCDKLLAETGLVPMPKALKVWATENGFNVNNAVIELYVWRKFMGFGKKANG